MASRDDIDLSVVIPLWNEEEVFARLVERVDGLVEVMRGKGVKMEVILVDDGSTDGTGEMIRAVCGSTLATDEHELAAIERGKEKIEKGAGWRGVVLSRNFGHQLAITAGMAHARGEAVAILDGDLQDPPEVVVEFYEKLMGNSGSDVNVKTGIGDGTLKGGIRTGEAFDVVYAVRRKRKENIFKKMAYAGFYRLMRGLATVPIPLDSGDFCIMRRRVVQEINGMGERHRFVRGLRSWVGFRQVGVSYPRAARHAGASKYSMRKLVKLALDGIFTFSEKPLQWSAQFGLLVAVCSVVYAAYIFVWRFFTHEQVPGFATLAVGLFFMGGVQLISIGILGEYIGRIHNEVKGRPLYIVAARYGFDEGDGIRKISAETRGGEMIGRSP